MEYKILRNNFKVLKLYRDFKGFFWLGFTCICLFAFFLFLTNIIFCEPNEFGDSAGATNGLFSALAFAGVIYVIFLQKHELSLQRQELKDTREEIAGQRMEYHQQNETLKRQRFENTFFQMLNLQQEIVQGLSFSYEKLYRNISSANGGVEEVYPEQRIVSGREIFYFTFEEAEHHVSSNTYIGMRQLLENEKMQGYENSNTPSYFDHYFRNLYRILKFVNESPLINDFDERYQYTSIVRGQLSRYELIWLYYNCLSVYGRTHFKPLIERYALLKNIREDLLIDDSSLGSYANSAYNKTIPTDAEQ